MKLWLTSLIVIALLSFTPTKAQNTGSAYLLGTGRIRVTDATPINPGADSSAYVITGNTITVESWIFPMSLPNCQDEYIVVDRPYWVEEPWAAYKLIIWNWSETDDPRIMFGLTDGTVPENGASVFDSNPAIIGSWTHIAGTYDGSMVKLYINGELVSEIPYTANIGEGNAGFYIGGVWSHFFHGLIDEVRLWNVARTQTQIQAAMDTTLAGDETGLVGYWPLDEGVEVNGVFPVAVDLTENHNDLEAQSGAEFVDAPAGSEVLIAPAFLLETLEGAVGAPFSLQPTVSGWPLSIDIAVVSGPSGLTVDPATGTVHWTPVVGQDGLHNFILEGTNAVGTSQETYTIWIDAFPKAIGEHNNNNTVLSVFNNGIIGASSDTDPVEGDAGFQFNGLNGLYEGDVVVAQSRDQVSGGLYIREFATQSAVQPIRSSLPGFDRAFEARYDDRRAPNPIGVSIIQRSHSKATSPDDDFVIVDYEIINTSSTVLSGIYVGLAMDWDVGAYGNNLGGYDAARKLSYMYELTAETNPNYYGVAVLTGEVSGHTVWTGQSGESEDPLLYDRMTTFDALPETPADQRAIIAGGSYIIPVGGRVRAMFAILGGTDLADLQANADAAAVLGDSFQPNPVISSVNDVPNDQGGWVYLNWTASDYDAQGQITQYGIWELNPENTLVSIGNVPATQEAQYTYLAHTFADSTVNGTSWSKFIVTAHTTDPGLFYSSAADSGFSIDNLAPAFPTGLIVARVSETGPGEVELAWDGPVDEDFGYFRVYRGTAPSFDPTNQEPLAEITDPAYTDTDLKLGVAVYYRVSAMDINGNESEYSNDVSATPNILALFESNNVPEEYAFRGNYPNPFNPSTNLSFDLPAATDLSLVVYDVLGREVLRLVDRNIEAGYHRVAWHGRDAGGNAVPAGVYIARLVTMEYTKSIKMALLK